MPKPGELSYYELIGEAGRQHAMRKPFSDEHRARVMMEIAAILRLLPNPPARILECGCGTGWLSSLLQQCGYEVVGVDVAPLAIDLARTNQLFNNEHTPTFLVADSEDLDFDNEFDVVLFFDSLHHSIDEQKAIDSAYRALKPGGICVTSETGPAHEVVAKEVAERYDVTEKAMPPKKILNLGREAGFRKSKVYPRGDQLCDILFESPRRMCEGKKGLLAKLLPFGLHKLVLSFAFMTVLKKSYGICVLEK